MDANKPQREIIRQKLQAFAEEDNKKFTSKLIPNHTREILGIRIPQLREFARELLKSDDFVPLLNPLPDDTHDEVMLRGLVIGAINCELPKKLQLIADFLPQIDNWAICDIFIPPIKVTDANRVEYRAFIDQYIASPHEYQQRFAIISLMKDYISDQYVDDTLTVLSNIKSTKYYVQMALAWALCDAFIKQREKTLKVLKRNSLDHFTHNKAIQKIRESRRVSTIDKEMLLSLKKSTVVTRQDQGTRGR